MSIKSIKFCLILLVVIQFVSTTPTIGLGLGVHRLRTFGTGFHGPIVSPVLTPGIVRPVGLLTPSVGLGVGPVLGIGHGLGLGVGHGLGLGVGHGLLPHHSLGLGLGLPFGHGFGFGHGLRHGLLFR